MRRKRAAHCPRDDCLRVLAGADTKAAGGGALRLALTLPNFNLNSRAASQVRWQQNSLGYVRVMEEGSVVRARLVIDSEEPPPVAAARPHGCVV